MNGPNNDFMISWQYSDLFKKRNANVILKSPGMHRYVILMEVLEDLSERDVEANWSHQIPESAPYPVQIFS